MSRPRKETPKPICPPRTRGGEQPEFVTSMLDPRAHRPYVPMPVRRYILDVRKGVKLQAFYSESEMVGICWCCSKKDSSARNAARGTRRPGSNPRNPHSALSLAQTAARSCIAGQVLTAIKIGACCGGHSRIRGQRPAVGTEAFATIAGAQSCMSRSIAPRWATKPRRVKG